MLTKKWFDRRAVAGDKWAVIAVKKTHLEYSTESFNLKVLTHTRYVACPFLNIPKHEGAEVLRDDLPKEEAMAMEKFLNFNEGVKK
jgi:hypothetical protein